MKFLGEFLAKITDAVGKPGEVVVAVGLIVTGLVVCFFGRRLLRPALCVGGFATGVLIGQPLIELIQHTFDPENIIVLQHDLVRAVPFVLGVILGIVFMNVLSVGMYVMAAAGGMVLFATVKDLIRVAFGGNIHPYLKIAILAFSALLPLIMVKFLEDIVVSICTAIVGSAVLTIGVDMFAKKGFFASLQRFWHIKDHHAGLFEELSKEKAKAVLEEVKKAAAEESGNKEVMFMFGGFLLVATAGAFYQLHIGRKNESKE